MLFTCQPKPLLEALQFVSQAIESRATIPVLLNVLVRADTDKPDTLILQGTNLDQAMTATLEVESHENAETGVTIPARALLDAVRKNADATALRFEVNAKNETISMTAGRRHATLGTLPADQFPELAAIDDQYALELEGKALAAALGNVTFAISTEETRYYLNGVFLHDDGGTAAVVATNGHILSYASLPGAEWPADAPSIIIPRMALSALQKLAEVAGETSLTLRWTERGMTLTSDGRTLRTKLVDGTFPDYKRVIPAATERGFRADRAKLATSMEFIISVAGKEGRAVVFEAEGEELNLSSGRAGEGAAADQLAIELPDGFESAGRFGISGAYLKQCLDSLQGDAALLQMADPGSPARITSDTTDTQIRVVMPMRV